ncbi:hypothetical protein UR09_00220 [Candidatus Nitromaritima sp. SCGC AAA799-A02]|nr:hypothetical protein UZ36_00215 [Candidatus Nitromaritima sp. SCGC AAA799-C22]KMP12745.1 hypothetical protein UR09_00220 [Candidatus Nitromaritima sp. SCGC AAA799-A02]
MLSPVPNAPVWAEHETLRADTEKSGLLTADRAVRLALVDTLYYRYEKWFSVFKVEIERLERSARTLGNQIELMKFHFAMAGLLGEFSHTLAFTSKFSIPEVKEDFIFHSERAKEVAWDILDRSDTDAKKRAEAYFYLGASEGYIGIFEYGAGHLITALINGLQADNHLEKALELDSRLVDVHFGLGVYRYGNSRLGGLSNFIMQGGEDLREVGLDHIEESLRRNTGAKPLAMKTLAWFYISEQINPDNRGLPESHPLHPVKCRTRALEIIVEMEDHYFKKAPYDDFIGNKEVALMKAIQFVLDRDYRKAREEFVNVQNIARMLLDRGLRINSQLTDSVQAGIEFCDLMLLLPGISNDPALIQSACSRINEKVSFLNSGGSMVQYDSRKIRGELHAVFAGELDQLSRQMQC